MLNTLSLPLTTPLGFFLTTPGLGASRDGPDNQRKENGKYAVSFLTSDSTIVLHVSIHFSEMKFYDRFPV